MTRAKDLAALAFCIALVGALACLPFALAFAFGALAAVIS